MSIYMKIVIGFCGVILLLNIGLRIYWSWHDKVFREGYEHGAIQTASYVKCSNWTKFPSAAFREEAWRFVNNGLDDNCALVRSIQIKIDAEEKQFQ